MSSASNELKLLTREALTPAEWEAVRDTPFLVAIAISQAEGSLVDAVLERAAGTKAIADGINNDHPLIRQIAAKSEMDDAISRMYATFAGPGGRAKKPAAELKTLAVEASRRVYDILLAKGRELDLYAYRTFINHVCGAVAEAAREGDVLGIGGTLVSDTERAVIAAVQDALHPAAGR